jgi:ribonuclease HI
MPRYVRMLLRNQKVWAHAHPDGRPFVGAEGRVEIRYRLEDPHAYRAAPHNLRPIPGEVPVEVPAVAEVALPAPTRRTLATHAHAPPTPSRASTTAPKTDLTPILVYTDGACTGNPGPMGIGAVLTADGQRREISEYLGQGTNNIAELTAVLRALEAIKDHDRPVHLHLDSSYAIGVLARGFKAKANVELITRIRRLMASFRDLHFVKVAGHAGVEENERCDELARAAVARGV